MAANVNKTVAPTVEQINADRITEVNYNTCSFFILYKKIFLQLAEKFWAPHSRQSHVTYDPQIIEDIYVQEIFGSK